MRNQGLIVCVANSNPQDRRTCVARCAEKWKVPILRDQDRRAGNGFIPNLLIGRCEQAEVGNVDRLATAVAQSRSQRGRKLRVDQKKQNLFRRDDGMICLTGSKGQNGIDIGVFEIGILLKDRFSGLANR